MTTPINDLMATGLTTHDLQAHLGCCRIESLRLMRKAKKTGAAHRFPGKLGWRCTREFADDVRRKHFPKPRYATR